MIGFCVGCQHVIYMAYKGEFEKTSFQIISQRRSIVPLTFIQFWRAAVQRNRLFERVACRGDEIAGETQDLIANDFVKLKRHRHP